MPARRLHPGYPAASARCSSLACRGAAFRPTEARERTPRVAPGAVSAAQYLRAALPGGHTTAAAATPNQPAPTTVLRGSAVPGDLELWPAPGTPAVRAASPRRCAARGTRYTVGTAVRVKDRKRNGIVVPCPRECPPGATSATCQRSRSAPPLGLDTRRRTGERRAHRGPTGGRPRDGR